jgi:hypothetical membrane protein
MNKRRLVTVLAGRYPMLGPILYVSSIQFFAGQIFVAMRWHPPYSLARDTISDLGNTACGTFNARFVCSPLHGLMNASFIVLGMAMTAGSLLISRRFAKSRAATVGFAAMAVSGIGVMIVGIFPENSVPAFHGLGTAVAFTVGNAALIIMAAAPMLPAALRLYSFLSGALAILALVSYSSSNYLGLGEGGIERVVAYPQAVWLIVIGVFLLVRIHSPSMVPAVRNAELGHPTTGSSTNEASVGLLLIR